MKPPRGLSEDEAAAWSHLARSVIPLDGKSAPTTPARKAREKQPQSQPPQEAAKPILVKRTPSRAVKRAASPPPVTPLRRIGQDQTLDRSWNRKLKAGQIAPDYTLDLHGHNLDSAYTRITSGLDQARAMNARVVLVIAGRERPVDPADRATKRGAIRAKLLDWLAASHHADSIAAIRRAHIRHGGEGALYVVLKKA